jgi:hypothetical protein
MSRSFVLAIDQLMTVGNDMAELCDDLAAGRFATLTEADRARLRACAEEWREALQECVATALPQLRKQ